MVMGIGSGLGGRSGVRPGTGSLFVSLAGSAISVAAGGAWLYRSGQGIYRAVLAAAWSGTLQAADATYGRVDLVYLRVWDSDVDASGLYQGDVVYLPGTPSATPSAPTPGASETYIPLGQITVPATGGASPSVTDVRPVTVAPGGILPTSTAPASPYVGQYYDDGTTLWRYNGSAWRQVSPTLPTVSNQVSSPGTYTAGSFVDFTSGQWPPITVIVPPSGIVAISIGAAVRNTATATSTGWLAWRASGALTEGSSEANGVSCQGGRTYATRRVIRSGLTPGTSLTITPQYQFSTVDPTTAITNVMNGQMSVEPISG
jgi:hypothetical protein